MYSIIIRLLSTKRLNATLALAVAFGASILSAPATIIRPYVEFEGETLDGYKDDFSDAIYDKDVSSGVANREGSSAVDLVTGTLKPSLQLQGSGITGMASAQLVDTINFSASSASSFSFRLQSGGMIQVGYNGLVPPEGQWTSELPQLRISTILQVYPGGSVTGLGTSGAIASAAPLASYSQSVGTIGLPGDDGNFLWEPDVYQDGLYGIFSDYSGSLPVNAGDSSFDIYAGIFLEGDSSDDGLVALDFSHTAALGINSDQPFTSQSGVFLDNQTIPVPEPSALWIGLIMLPFFLWRAARNQYQTQRHKHVPMR